MKSKRKKDRSVSAPIPGEETKSSRKTTTIIFWAVNFLFFLFALIIRFASPTTIINPIQSIKPISVIPSNVCVSVNHRILDISRTARTEQYELTAKVNALHAYVKKTVNNIPKHKDEFFTPEFLRNINDLNKELSEWSQDKNLSKNETIVPLLISYRGKFRSTLRKLPRRHVSWYINLSRFSTGYLEGFSSILLLPYRTAVCFMKGKISFKNVAAPPGWRREGVFFYVALMYTSLLCIYLFALLAQKFRKNMFYIPGLISLLYGTGHFIIFLYKVSKSIPEVIKKVISMF